MRRPSRSRTRTPTCFPAYRARGRWWRRPDHTAMARLLSMFCILAVFVPSFFMIGVSRQLFVPLSLAVAFSMIASYLLSSTLVPVFSTWLMREAHRGEESEGLFGRLRNVLRRGIWTWCCGSAGRCVAVYLVTSIGMLVSAACRVSARSCSRTRMPPLLRLRLRAPAGTRIEETERTVLHALDIIRREAGPDNVEITSDFLGLIPSSYPVDLIHLFTSGPQDAIIQVALKPDAPAGRSLRERLRQSLRRELPGTDGVVRSRRHRQPGNELRISDADRGCRSGHQSSGRLRASRESCEPGWPGCAFCATCSSRRCPTIRRWTSRSTATAPASSA